MRCVLARRVLPVVLVAASLTVVTAGAGADSATTTSLAGGGVSTTTSTTTSTVRSTTTTTMAVARGPVLRLGSRGEAVRVVQSRLAALHYWIGGVTGVFSDATQQAVYAIQKVAGLRPDGVVGASTRAALVRGVKPRPRAAASRTVQVSLARDLVMIARDGALVATLNTSTGGGYSYSVGGSSGVAITPRGHFLVYRQVNGLDTGPLGAMWRPKYFSGGFAIHGSWSVPPTPVSHGCVRLSLEAMDWIWATNQLPIGAKVWIY